MKKKLINHVALVIDDSPSMGHLISKTREVVNAQLKGFAATSALKNQETRVSVYVFGGTLQCIAFDVPPETVTDARNYVRAGISATAMMDATGEVIRQMGAISTRNGDHSFLIYVITDGEDNASRYYDAPILERAIKALSDDWTVAALVPNVSGKHHCKTFGLPSDNIEIWDATSEQGMEEVGQTICDSYQMYSAARSAGTKSTKSLFSFKGDLTKTEVKKTLEEVDPGTYHTHIVRPYHDEWPIKEFVESVTKRPYRTGSAYYQVTKPEAIQAGKAIAVVEDSTGKMYSGLKARSLLGLPSDEVKVSPADFTKFKLFVQSTSTNRKLVGNTHLIVFN